MSEIYKNTGELKQAIKLALASSGNEFAIQSFNRLSYMNVQIKLDPERTDYQPNRNGLGGTIHMSNQKISATEQYHNAKDALAGIFSHEFSHALDHDYVIAVWNDSKSFNNREISINNFYKIEASAIARQYVLKTDFGLNIGLQNASLRDFYNQTHALFDNREITWTAFETNLRAEIAARQKADGTYAPSANKYANAVAAAVGTPAASAGNIGAGFGSGWAVVYQAPPSGGNPGNGDTNQPTFIDRPEEGNDADFLTTGQRSSSGARLNQQVAGLVSAMSAFSTDADPLISGNSARHMANWHDHLAVNIA